MTTEATTPTATPAPPAAAPKPAIAVAPTVTTTHHLFTLAIVGVLVIASVYGVEKLIYAHDSQTSAKYNAIVAAQTQQTQILQKQLQTDEASWAQVEAQLLAQNAQLTQQITARNQAVAAQVKNDATLSTQQAAARIAQQTNAAPGEVVASANDVTIDLPITRIITSDLDQLPVAESDLADTTSQLKNETQIATNAQSDATEAKKVVAAQVTQLADQDKACKAEVATVRSDARKGKLKWFFIGVFTGFIGGHLK